MHSEHKTEKNNKTRKTTLITSCFLGLILSVTAVAETKVYITRDKNGNPVYSDRKSPDAENIVVKELPTVPAMKVPDKGEVSDAASDKTEYQRMGIVSPATGSTLNPGDAGNTEIAGILIPGLQSGHSIVLTDNGNEVARGQKPGFQLTNLDRGEHIFVLQVRNKDDKILISSAPVTIYVQRPSALN